EADRARTLRPGSGRRVRPSPRALSHGRGGASTGPALPRTPRARDSGRTAGAAPGGIGGAVGSPQTYRQGGTGERVETAGAAPFHRQPGTRISLANYRVVRDIPFSRIKIPASEWALNGLTPPHSKIICIPEEKKHSEFYLQHLYQIIHKHQAHPATSH
ncbi:hypothetical protein DV515_00008207, partial [Chloebia gouldiae]